MRRTTFLFIFAFCLKSGHFLPFLEEFAIEEEAFNFEKSNEPTESKYYSMRKKWFSIYELLETNVVENSQ